MIKVGITGNIACGKSCMAIILKEADFIVVDCDDIVKTLYCDNAFVSEIAKNFPMIITNSKINTKLISDLLFSDNNFKNKFESFIFPKVKEKIIEFFEKNNGKKVFVIAPLLFEAGFDNMFDKIIFISANEKVRRERLIARNSMLSNMADQVIKAQMSEEEKIQKSDYVIKNNGTLEEFKSTVLNFINKLI